LANPLEAWLDQAREHQRQGRMEASAECYREVLRFEPGHVDAAAELADALESLGRNAEAISTLEDSLSCSAHSARLHTRLGDSLQAQGDLPRAIEMYRRSTALDKALAATWWGLGCAQTSLGDFAPAADSFRILASLQPENGLAFHNLGRSLFELGQVDPAIAAFRKSLDHIAEEMREMPLRAIAVTIPGSPAATNQDILDARRAWAAHYLPPPASGKVFPGRTADRQRPLRLGYVSAFFARQNWMKPVWGLIEQHDHAQFEIHVFSDGPEPSPELGYHGDPRVQFHNVNGSSNAKLADLIEHEAIDILVDLNAFSWPARLPLYSLRPAPIQAVWFNHFAPSGLSSFDYIIGDAHVVSMEDERYYPEKVVRVPGSYMTFQVPYSVPAVVPPPCLERGYVTFGCLAPQYKITTQVVESWARIMNESPATRLVLKNFTLAKPAARDFVHGLFSRFSISPERVDLDGPAEHFTFLERYSDIDIALDTFPYNGGTTTMEALWQGVPVLTFAGERWSGRTSASLLREAGLAEFVAPDVGGFVNQAVALASQPDLAARLATLRSSMRDRLSAAPVCDVRSFTRKLESAFLQMWSMCAESV
jgi:protein O-GlcNAc transferase